MTVCTFLVPKLMLLPCLQLSRWASLVVQWLRIRLPMQGTRVQSLVWEDPTCHEATKPVRRNYGGSAGPRACALPTSEITARRSLRTATREQPCSLQLEEACVQQQNPRAAKNKFKNQLSSDSPVPTAWRHDVTSPKSGEQVWLGLTSHLCPQPHESPLVPQAHLTLTSGLWHLLLSLPGAHIPFPIFSSTGSCLRIL